MISISNKAQTSYIVKPITLIVTIILLVFLLQTVYKNSGKEKIVEKNLDIVGSATDILLILANSRECLAYSDSTTKANILDVGKLNSFDSNYQEIEPECARNYDFGWRVKVIEFDNNDAPKERWSFGAKEFSTGKSSNNQIEFWIPVAIRYSENNVKLGKMEIKIVDGELEKLAGFFDWSCKMGELNRITSLSTGIAINQPVSYGNGELCIDSSCRKLSCELVYFDGLESEGTYEITVNYQEPNKLLVSK